MTKVDLAGNDISDGTNLILLNLEMKKINKIYTVIIAVIVVLILTNPTQKDMDNYLRAKDISAYGGRTGYFLIFSRYDVRERGYNARRFAYIGIFKNFLLIKIEGE